MPREFLDQWKDIHPEAPVKFSTLSQYLNSFQPAKLDLPVVRAGTSYTFDSFWIECPRVKTWYRSDEHTLQAAETLATIASLTAGFEYPVQPFYHSWLQMLLNMDRNTLWGSSGGMVFEHETSWDAKDRFEWVEKQTGSALADVTVKAGPRKGRILAIEKQNAEFFVEKDRTISIAFYDDAMKARPAADQVVTAIAETPAGKVKLEFEKKGDFLVSKSPLPAGENYTVVVQLKPTAEAKPKNFRITLDLSTCAGCSNPEYACTCDE